jgi:chromosome segregation protein
MRLEARTAELRQGEAELETLRQAHYAAGDELHTAQGSLAEAALEVSRLEERIRYVVEGRQRVEQRLLEIKPKTINGARVSKKRKMNWSALPNKCSLQMSKTSCWPRKPKNRTTRCRSWKTNCVPRRTRPTNSATRWWWFSSKFRCWPAKAAALTSSVKQFSSRRERLAGERQQIASPDMARLAGACEINLPWPKRRKASPKHACMNWPNNCPSWTKSRRHKQEQLNLESGKQSEFTARLSAL